MFARMTALHSMRRRRRVRKFKEFSKAAARRSERRKRGDKAQRGAAASETDRGRSPSAARAQSEALQITPALGCQRTRCDPGQFAVRRIRTT